MNLNQFADLKFELVGLCNDIHLEIQSQVNYYLVSAYKVETHQHIQDKIATLEAVVRLFAGPDIVDLFADYRTTAAQSSFLGKPDTGSKIARIQQLLDQLRSYYSSFMQSDPSPAEAAATFTRVKAELPMMAGLAKTNHQRLRYLQSL